MTSNKPVISASDVYDAIRQGKAIKGVSIFEPIKVTEVKRDDDTPGTHIDHAIQFTDCFIRELDANTLIFHQMVTFRRCIFIKARLYSTYVLAGLTIDNCHFFEEVSLLTSGAHNLYGTVTIMDSVFEDYVDIMDADFQGDLEIRSCTFRKGTNLLGNKGKGYEVTFEGHDPIIEDNLGDMDLD